MKVYKERDELTPGAASGDPCGGEPGAWCESRRRLCWVLPKPPRLPSGWGKFGKPMSDKDWGFYVGYKQGHPCVAVDAGGLTFYGTTDSTTLAAEGVTVEKELSPHFGICFGGE